MTLTRPEQDLNNVAVFFLGMDSLTTPNLQEMAYFSESLRFTFLILIFVLYLHLLKVLIR